MKTTLDLDDDLREKLLHLAAQREDEDLSRIINNAIRQYFEDLEANQQKERLQRGSRSGGASLTRTRTTCAPW